MLKVSLLQSEDYYKIDKIEFKQDDKGAFFFLQSSQTPQINILVNYPLPVYKNYKASEYLCITLVTSIYFKENDIFEVHSNESRIGRLGWVFPIQALVSNEHSYADNEHFLKYAFVAFHKLILGDFFENDVNIKIESFEDEISLNNIFNSSLIILCLSQNKTNKIPKFQIKNYAHSLYEYNYFLCKNLNETQGIYPSHSDTPFITKVTITAISNDLKEEVFIRALFEDHLKFDLHPLVKFHLLYQIVELLINRVYDVEVKFIIDSAKEATKSTYDLLKRIEAVAKEEFRVKKLFNNYLTKGLTSVDSLIESGNVILSHFGSSKADAAEVFYGVRNKIVHDFRTIAAIDPNYVALKKINNDFEKILLHVLTYYTEHEDQLFDYKPLQWLVYKSLSE